MAPNSLFLHLAFLLLLSIHPSHEFDAIGFARNHLKSFGYLSHNYTTVDVAANDSALESALRTYQSFYRLNVTGRVEPDTLTSMMRPRCGVPDQVTPDYAFLGTTWPPSKRTLTYWFNTPVLFPIDTMRTILSNSFSQWSAVSTFSFKEDPTAARPDLSIGFFNLEHGDGDPFDGTGGVLAHSFPPTSGAFHYDADEDWSTQPGPDQFDLESIALHEIGHLLGLGHSAEETSVMFAYFAGGTTKRLLQTDDMDGIYALYPQG